MMDKLQSIMETMSNDMMPSWEDVVWLIETVEQQEEEIENLQASCRMKQAHIDHIPKIREEYETKLKQANTRIQFLEGLRSAKA